MNSDQPMPRKVSTNVSDMLALFSVVLVNERGVTDERVSNEELYKLFVGLQRGKYRLCVDPLRHAKIRQHVAAVIGRDIPENCAPSILGVPIVSAKDTPTDEFWAIAPGAGRAAHVDRWTIRGGHLRRIERVMDPGPKPDPKDNGGFSLR